MLGCPLLITAQTRIIVSDACMRDQMISRAVRPHEVETFSRCRGQRFRAPTVWGPSIHPSSWWAGENVVLIFLARKLGRRVGPLGTELNPRD